MANTYSQLYIHIVFAVRDRECIISKKWKEELFKYISGIIKSLKQKLYIINGYKDHIHILLSINPDINISDVVGKIKSNSSKFINEKKFTLGKFYWQEGFGAFTVSAHDVGMMINYIKGQEEHHKVKTFQEEYLELLKEYNIEFDMKYIFKPVQ